MDKFRYPILIADTKNLLRYVSQLNSQLNALEQNEPGSTILGKAAIDTFLRELLAVYRSLLKRSILVIQQPEEIIKKEQKFDTQIQLIGDIFSTDTTMRVRIITSEHCEALKTGALSCDQVAAAAIVVNNTAKMLSSDDKQLLSHFAKKKPTMSRILPRPATNGRAVTEQKNFVLYEVILNPSIQQKLGFKIWTVSLPVVLISAANQQSAANATILWDRVFGNQDEANWAEFCCLLNVAFKRLSGAQTRELSESDLAYFRQKLHIATTADATVSFQRFAKDNISQVERERFSFWTWFESVARLIGTRLLLPLWEKDYIMGFHSKDEMCTKVCDLNQSAFVLRFSDNYLKTFTVSTFRRNVAGLIEHYPYVIDDEKLRLESSVALLKSVKEIRDIRFIYTKDFSLVDKSVIYSDPEMSEQRGTEPEQQFNGYFRLKSSDEEADDDRRPHSAGISVSAVMSPSQVAEEYTQQYNTNESRQSFDGDNYPILPSASNEPHENIDQPGGGDTLPLTERDYAMIDEILSAIRMDVDEQV